jgi:hypothetical protein
VHDRRSKPQLGEKQRVARGRRLRHRREADGVLAAHQVIGEVEQIDRDAREKQRILHERQHRVQLRPSQVERLEVLEAARAEHTALQRLTACRQLRKEALGVDARERRERLLAR